MTISFNEIPNSLRVPFVAAEIDASQASQGPALLNYRAIIIGQLLSAGSASANELHRVTNVEQVIALAGRGSMLHRQAIAWFDVNKLTEVYIGTLADDGGGTAATGTITASGPATADGTIALYLGGERITVAVSSGDADSDVATAIVAAITAAADLPITAAVNGGDDTQVDITFRHAGEVGNYYDMRDSYRDGEQLPAGVGLTYGAMSSGAGNPALTTLIAAMGDTWYNVLAHPYTDATNLTAIENELASRFGPMRMIDGVAITSAADTLANLATLGNGRNSPHNCIVAQPGENPLTPPMEHACQVAGVAARYAQADPARPLQTLPLTRTLAPAETDRFTISELNSLLFDGIATTQVGGGDVVQISRLITTYQTNSAGAADTAYLDAATMFTLMYLRYSWRQRILTKYPRHKLANDGTRIGPGQAVMTPKLGKAEALGWFRQMEREGLVEGFEQFKTDLIVARNQADPNRLDVLLPPDLINQLIVTATQFGFRL